MIHGDRNITGKSDCVTSPTRLSCQPVFQTRHCIFTYLKSQKARPQRVENIEKFSKPEICEETGMEAAYMILHREKKRKEKKENASHSDILEFKVVLF